MLYGVSVGENDCRSILDLLRVGRADDLTAASAIDRGLDAGAKLVALTPAERDAILGVLDDPPDSLVDLRGRLARDHRERQK